MQLRPRQNKEQQIGQYFHFLREKVERHGFEKVYINKAIGYGVIATKSFKKGEFLLQYPGDLISEREGKRRNTIYAEEGHGCYLFYFSHNGRRYCIDGTKASGLGRLVNDSKDGNCVVRKIVCDELPHLVLFAKDDIKKGSELRFNYGDTRSLWWRNQDAGSGCSSNRQETSEKQTLVKIETSTSSDRERGFKEEVKKEESFKEEVENMYFVCKLCKKRFSRSHNKNRHIRECHKKEKRPNIKVECERCGRLLSNNCSLRRHMKLLHSE